MMKRKSTYVALAGISVVIATFQIWNVVIGPVLRAIVRGDEGDYADAVFGMLVLAITCGAIVVGTLAGVTPGVLRQRAVGRMAAQSGALIVTARVNSELREVLSAGLLLKETAAQKNLRGYTFAVSANASGIQFWVGTRNPESIVELEWADVHRVTMGSFNDGARDLSAVSMQVRSSSSDATILLFVRGGRTSSRRIPLEARLGGSGRACARGSSS